MVVIGLTIYLIFNYLLITSVNASASVTTNINSIPCLIALISSTGKRTL